MDILNTIGNASMAQLRKVVPPNCGDILVKLEWENPTGSVKDRMAYTVISGAEEDGRLKPGDTVVEYTGGSTGTSLALVCAAKGYRLHIVSSDAFSREKLDHMAALGAQLTLVPSEGGLTTKGLGPARWTRKPRARSRRFGKRSGDCDGSWATCTSGSTSLSGCSVRRANWNGFLAARRPDGRPDATGGS